MLCILLKGLHCHLQRRSEKWFGKAGLLQSPPNNEFLVLAFMGSIGWEEHQGNHFTRRFCKSTQNVCVVDFEACRQSKLLESSVNIGVSSSKPYTKECFFFLQANPTQAGKGGGIMKSEGASHLWSWFCQVVLYSKQIMGRPTYPLWIPLFPKTGEVLVNSFSKQTLD